MKKRLLLATLVLIAVSIGFWWILRVKDTSFATTEKATDSQEKSNVQVAAKGQDQPQHSTIPNIGGAVKRAKETIDAAKSANVPIAFWGKVVDQDGNALAGATVKLGVRHWVLTPTLGGQGRSIKTETQTGSDGTFSISNASGDVLAIDEIRKNGYELSPKAVRAFNYQRGAAANPDNPVIFKMWKRGEPQQLVSYHLSRIGIPCDGTPVLFDLASGKRVNAGGDLRVTLTRNPVNIPRGNARYDWTASFEIINGGLQAQDDEFMRSAPEAGYAPVWSVTVLRDDPNWISMLEKQFYVSLQNGKQYGKIIVRLNTSYQPPPTGLTIDVAINPSGSRSLE